MNKRTTKSEILFMLVLSAVCSLLLSGTRAVVGDLAELSDRTVSAVFDITDYKCEKNELFPKFKEAFNQIQKGKVKIWRSNFSKSVFACEATGSGMWDEITIVFVYEAFTGRILGLRVTEQKETAGVGSRITEEDFYGQFTNSELGRVDAISGATTSSMAVERLLAKSVAVVTAKAQEVAND